MKDLKYIVILNVIIMLYSLGNVCSKTAASKPFLSFEFIFFYGLVLLILGIYAILWQQILKKLPLNVSYANKSVTIIWAIIWGVIFFKETVTLNMIIGAAVVFIGILLMVTGEEKHNE